MPPAVPCKRVFGSRGSMPPPRPTVHSTWPPLNVALKVLSPSKDFIQPQRQSLPHCQQPDSAPSCKAGPLLLTHTGLRHASAFTHVTPSA